MRADFDAPEPGLGGGARYLAGTGAAGVDAGVRSRRPGRSREQRGERAERSKPP